ncbi:MAG TPA: ribbon-helix-helix domain-containing protein, partial [Alphaproteobacteria bacterium]
QSRVRIVQHAGKRFALRLEGSFWDMLERIARKRQLRLGQLVASLAESYEGINFSSYIRAYAQAEAQRELARQDITLSPFDLLDILRNCPAPGLLMQHNRTILEANNGLLQWLGADAPALRLQGFDTIFEPRVTRPLHETMDLLYHGQVKRTQIQVAYTPPVSEQNPRPAIRAALATLHGFYNPQGAFYCLVWFTGSPALQLKQNPVPISE